MCHREATGWNTSGVTSVTAGEVAMAIAAIAAMRDVTVAIAMAIAIATRLAIGVATTVATGVVAISRMAMKGIPMHKVCHVASIHSRIPSIIPTEDGTLGAAVVFLGCRPQGEPVFHTFIAMKRFITMISWIHHWLLHFLNHMHWSRPVMRRWQMVHYMMDHMHWMLGWCRCWTTCHFLVLTAPLLLSERPAVAPIGESCIAVERMW